MTRIKPDKNAIHKLYLTQYQRKRGTMAGPRTPEGKVKREIMEYLSSIGCFAFYTPNTTQKGRRATEYQPKGIADVHGLYRGWALAMEIKAPGQKLRKEQAEYLYNFTQAGGKGFVASCVSDVKQVLDNLPNREKASVPHETHVRFRWHGTKFMGECA